MVTPFFWINSAQTLDTFKNNFFRTALTSFIMFEIAIFTPSIRATLAASAVALLMLPSFLVSALAGELADKYPKNRVIKIICISQIFFAVFGCLGFKSAFLPILFISLLGMGTSGSMLSPVKYSILPEVVPANKLLLANGLMEATVYIAILGGTILGGMVFSLPPYLLYITLLTTSVLTAISSLFIPEQKVANSQLKINANFFMSTFKSITEVTCNRRIFIYIIAISWFWGIGTIILSQIPALASFLGGKDSLFTLFVVLFSCGIGVGSLLSELVLRGKVSDKYSIISLFMVTLCLGYLTYLCKHVPSPSFDTLHLFLQSTFGKHIVVTLFLFAVFGGLYIVPLTSLLQLLAPVENRTRIIASNNIINSFFMVIGSISCSVLLWKHISISSLFALLALANLLATIAIFIIFRKMRGQNV